MKHASKALSEFRRLLPAVAKDTRNPGNVMNNDAGNVHYYPTWSAGVEGVARWLSKHKFSR